MRFSPGLRGGLQIFGAVFLFETGLVAVKLLLESSQQGDGGDPLMFLVPGVMGLVLAAGLGVWHVRKAKRSVPGAVDFDRYGFTVNREAGSRERISWRLVTSVIYHAGEQGEWIFALRQGSPVSVSRRDYSFDEWRRLSAEFEKRLKRRGLEVGLPPVDMN